MYIINSNYDSGRHKIPGYRFLAGLGTWEYVESRNADDSTAQDGHGMASNAIVHGRLEMENGKHLSPWSGHRYHNIYAYDNGNVRRFSLSGYYGRPSSGIVAPTVAAAAAETRIECCRGRALNMR